MNPSFKISGKYGKKNRKQIFTKEISSVSEDLALEKLYSVMGSNHKLKRSQIQITKVEESKGEKNE